LESLNKFKEEFEKDHATVTYWRLHDAKVAIETAPPSPFMDKGDVFASLRGKGVQLPLGKAVPPGSSREKINHFVRALLVCKKKKLKKKIKIKIQTLTSIPNLGLW
jgi:hypothetical protein